MLIWAPDRLTENYTKTFVILTHPQLKNTIHISQMLQTFKRAATIWTSDETKAYVHKIRRKKNKKQDLIFSAVQPNAAKPSWCSPLWWGNHRSCESCSRRSWSALGPERAAALPAVCTRSATPAYIPGRPPAPTAPPDTTTETKPAQGSARDTDNTQAYKMSQIRPQYASKCLRLSLSFSLTVRFTGKIVQYKCKTEGCNDSTVPICKHPWGSYFLTTGFFSHNINQTKMCNTLVSDQIPSKPELYFVFSAH